ncbi:MAG: LamG domain-containing protein, partial [Chitinispirillaceae bacterium]|nr:LamG domain-containing protein [Chitinispirillaceae bacterium]
QADSFYTVSAWVYLRNTQRDNRVIVSKGSAHYGLRANERNQWEFYGGLRGYGVDTTTTSEATVNSWILLTGVRNGMRQYLYVNGAAADSTTSAAGVGASISDNYYDLVIGRQSDDESQWFDGLIDEVRVENRARTAAWVRLCYENQRIDQRFVMIHKIR